MLFLCKSLKFTLFFSDKVEEESSKSAAETEVSTGMTLEFARLPFKGMNHHNTLLLLRYAQYCDVCCDFLWVTVLLCRHTWLDSEHLAHVIDWKVSCTLVPLCLFTFSRLVLFPSLSPSPSRCQRRTSKVSWLLILPWRWEMAHRACWNRTRLA